MPWQQHVADIVLELLPGTTELAYSEYGLTVPRQSGKSTFVLAKATHRGSAGGFFGPRQHMVYTAQTRQKAREKFEEDYAAELLASRAFRDAKPYWGSGNEHIRYRNKSKFAIEANTEKAGHGGTLDEAFIDEAFAHMDSRLEQAFRPAMITRHNKQLGWISTAGWTDASVYLQEKVKLGRAAVAADERVGLAYFEWSAPDGSDPSDHDVWRACMPALGHTITIEAIEAEFKAMKRADFMRAYLNMWVPRSASDGWLVVPESDWNGARVDTNSEALDPTTLAVEFSHTRSHAAIAMAGARSDGRSHVEITGDLAGTVDHRLGTAWVLPRLLSIFASPTPPRAVVIDEKGPAEALIKPIEAAGITVIRPGPRDLCAAYAHLVDGCNPAHDLVRHRGQPGLTDSVQGATRRNLGDQTTWERKSGDASQHVAASLALWGHLNAPASQFFGSWR